MLFVKHNANTSLTNLTYWPLILVVQRLIFFSFWLSIFYHQRYIPKTKSCSGWRIWRCRARNSFVLPAHNSEDCRRWSNTYTSFVIIHTRSNDRTFERKKIIYQTIRNVLVCVFFFLLFLKVRLQKCYRGACSNAQNVSMSVRIVYLCLLHTSRTVAVISKVFQIKVSFSKANLFRIKLNNNYPIIRCKWEIVKRIGAGNLHTTIQLHL